MARQKHKNKVSGRCFKKIEDNINRKEMKIIVIITTVITIMIIVMIVIIILKIRMTIIVI